MVDVVESARVVLNQWQYAQHKSFDHFLGFMTPADGDEHLTFPIKSTIKVNFDVVIFESFNRYSISYVVGY